MFLLLKKFKIGAIVGFSYSLLSLLLFSIIASSGEFSGMFNTLPIFIQLFLVFPVYVLTVIWFPLVALEMNIQNAIFAYGSSTSLIYQYSPQYASSYLSPIILVFVFTMVGALVQKMVGFVKK